MLTLHLDLDPAIEGLIQAVCAAEQTDAEGLLVEALLGHVGRMAIDAENGEDVTGPKYWTRQGWALAREYEAHLLRAVRQAPRARRAIRKAKA